MGTRYLSAMKARLSSSLFATMAMLALLPVAESRAQQTPPVPKPDATAAAGDIADFFGQMGDQIYEDCIFELSEEQLDVQQALIAAYVKHGAPSAMARQLAVKQIRPPQLSEKCESMKSMARAAPSPVPAVRPPVAKKWTPEVTRAKAPPQLPPPSISLANKEVLPQWDCAPNVDYVTIQHKGFERKLTGGEICNPFEDVVHQVPEAAGTFRLGYTIRTGRLFVVSSDPQFNGKTIAWAISGREACRNNPDPDCLAARAVGPLPPGEYAFAGDKDKRVTWGPNAKRMVAGIYLTKLWNRELLTPAQTAAVLARGNIAIHVRLKGEMSEACLGLGAEGWAYVSSLIKEGRATGVNVYINEPHTQIAEAAPIIKASTFSLSSLFK
ncbi:MAG TPA: DUF2778 domain-containing protein [Hyphomicrobiaceae bacterium]|nr:DUF2778 domain-containing protein [Hyphomicrobiaceae bacterium]